MIHRDDDLILDLFIMMQDPKGRMRSIRVSKDDVYRDTEENPFLPLSQIEIVERAQKIAPSKIRVPLWLAKKKGLI